MDCDNSEESFQHRALEVHEPGVDFDPEAVPQTGEEFLTRMVYERKRCPAVVTCRPKRSATSQPSIDDANLEKYSQETAAPTNHLPTPQRKELQLADFEEMRKTVALLHQKMNTDNITNDVELPLTTDADEWKSFCRQNPPVLKTILRINQRMLENLLEFFGEWLSYEDETTPDQETLSNSSSSLLSSTTTPITVDLVGDDEWLGSWVYATLACLQLPLEPQVHNSLRDIARICIRLRSRLLPHEAEKAIPLNLFIHLIAKGFDQFDLAVFV